MSKKKKKPNPVAQAMVAMRNKKLTPERRKEIATKAANERWAGREAKDASTSSRPKTAST
jgi:hypothetical protein